MPFSEAAQYWDDRYSHGGDSGSGSFGRLAAYKAEVLNAFIKRHGIESVIEFGCGDGNQVSLATYPRYLGLDVSEQAIKLCQTRFPDDHSKRFLISEDYDGERCDLSLSLDVIYHLVEDEVFDGYMRDLFSASRRYVIIYSSNHAAPSASRHVHHRRFTDWVALNTPDARLLRRIPNRFPYDATSPEDTSFSDFYIFEVTADPDIDALSRPAGKEAQPFVPASPAIAASTVDRDKSELPIPNLVILGAQKSGTTSLHNALGQHPEIFMSTPLKEATYFFPLPDLRKRLARYGFGDITTQEELLEKAMLQGYSGEAIFGESSTDYTYAKRSRKLAIAERMEISSPGMKFLYILRNPFDRILSVQRHNYNRHGIDTFREISEGNKSALNQVLLTSCYHYQISTYLKHFDTERFLLLNFDDLTSNQSGLLEKVFDFLRVKPVDDIPDFRSNASRPETSGDRTGIPRTVLEEMYDRIISDLSKLEKSFGFSVPEWDLSFERWCDHSS